MHIIILKRVVIILLLCLLQLPIIAQSQNRWKQIDWVSTVSAPTNYMATPQGGAYKFADVNQTNFDMHNSGTIEQINGNTYRWSIGIRANYALNIFAFLTNVKLNNNDQISIQTPTDSYCYVYEATDISSNGTLLTTPLPGDSIIISVISDDIKQTQLTIESVAVGFRSMPEHLTSENRTLKATGYGTSGNCENSVSCIDELDTLKQSVCRLVMYGTDGAYWGTGVLVNNTANDGTPYLLTAAHCLAGDFKYCLAQFNFESPLCQDIEPHVSTTEQLRASTMLVRNDKRDVLLLLLDNKPAEETMAYYAGWNATNTLPDGQLHCIHHPQADVKMVSETESATPNISYTVDKTNDGDSFDVKCHWKINGWNYGSTESGSSGSPLFDANGHVVGNLTGGLSSCSRPDKSDYYWMLSENWSELSPYLDKANTGATTLDGKFCANEKMYTTLYTGTTDEDLISDRIEYGFVAGHNSYKTTKLAQLFTTTYSDINIYGVYLATKKVMTTNGDSFNINFWKSENNEVGEQIYTETYSNSTLKTNKISYIPLSKTIKVDSCFYVGMEINYNGSATDSIALYYQKGSGAQFYNGAWHKANYFLPELTDASLFVGIKGIGTIKETIIDTTTIIIDTTNVSQLTLCQHTDNRIEILGKKIKKVSLYDTMGKRIINSDNIETDMYTIDMNQVARGIYIIWVISENKERKYKILNR